jgi:Spy/CpxP family protein refolding chaperone
MEEKMKRITLILTILSIAFVTISTSAQPGRKRGADRAPGFNIERLTQALGLTEEQATQIQQMHYENAKAEIELRSSLKLNRLELKNMVATNNIVESEILGITEKNSELTSTLKKNKIQLWLDIYKVLNPEQQKKWTKHFQNMGERFRERADRMRKERIREDRPERPGFDK